MPPVGFEPTISASERPQTYALDRAATGNGLFMVYLLIFPVAQTNVSQPPGRCPVPGPGINYTWPRDILLELITNLNVI